MNCKSDKQTQPKEIDMLNEDLEKYKLIYQAYESEIKNLWQRSIFLGAFMILVWSGYGALQLKFIEKCISQPNLYHCASIGLCMVLVVLSWLWIAMAKGSKFIQEAHEDRVKKFQYFCNLDNYEENRKNMQKISGFWCPFYAYRFSVSKINIVLGWVSLLVAFGLLVVHIKYRLYREYAIQFITDLICQNWFICLAVSVFFVLPFLMYLFVKGGKTFVRCIIKCVLIILCIQMLFDTIKELA